MFHFNNVWLHAYVSVLALIAYERVLHALGGARRDEEFGVPFAAALLFAAHPVHTEAVSGIVGRAELLSAAFVLLAFNTWPDPRGGLFSPGYTRKAAFVALSFALVGCAFLSKETGVGAFGLVVLFEWAARLCDPSRAPAPLAAPEPEAGVLKRYLRWYRGVIWKYANAIVVTCFALLVAVKLVRTRHELAGGASVVKGFRRLDNQLAFLDGSALTLTRNRCWYEYARLLAWPRDLTADYSYAAVPNIETLDDPRNIGPALLGLGVAAALCRGTVNLMVYGWTRGDGAVVAFCALWGFGFFLPASHVFFFPGTFVAERLLYMPSLGFCLALAVGLRRLADALIRAGAAAASRVLAFARVGGDLVYDPVLKDGTPNPRPNARDRRRLRLKPKQEAYAVAHRAGLVAAITSRRSTVRAFMGLVACCLYRYATWTMARNVEWASQASLFESALRVAPGSAKVRLNVGIAAHERAQPAVAAVNDGARDAADLAPGARTDASGHLDAALAHFEAAVAVEPSFDAFCQPHYWAGRALLDRRDFGGAVARFQRALSCRELDHDRYAREALETVYAERLRHVPHDGTTASNLANVLMLGGRHGEAAAAFERSIKHTAPSADVLANFAMCRRAQGKLKGARKLYRRALEADPRHARAKEGLAEVEAKLPKKKKKTTTKVKTKAAAAQPAATGAVFASVPLTVGPPGQGQEVTFELRESERADVVGAVKRWLTGYGVSGDDNVNVVVGAVRQQLAAADKAAAEKAATDKAAAAKAAAEAAAAKTKEADETAKKDALKKKTKKAKKAAETAKRAKAARRRRRKADRKKGSGKDEL